ncbi:MAG: hypothetical protein A2782_03555 [Candidatus Blackburnbacteria bacterium RIFCSPHIGHO2_01_FULL_43_15b]|uniref:Uncharacterized protein n=1 Tax=Candidatus Blackburnbacteria bacterium RIFCSPHIGHO2_01_FULL_43_15b TaxID=1797513 RepID=A0A1G1V383_9BACT|nr:MAG: hypothetical protein A2782_03555 [Candidatus Blackburnbacteria bacterium RIFCSPHIGHO2_01_FULL_43_15b]
MTEALGTIPARVEVASLSRELPSLSFVLALPDYNLESGKWHGRIVLRGRIADINITMFNTKTFPVWGEVLVVSGTSSERWKFEEKADSLEGNLISDRPSSLLLSDVVAPEQRRYGVGFSLALKRTLPDPHERIRTDDVRWSRSKIGGVGNTHNVAAVVGELAELVHSIRAL